MDPGRERFRSSHSPVETFAPQDPEAPPSIAAGQPFIEKLLPVMLGHEFHWERGSTLTAGFCRARTIGKERPMSACRIRSAALALLLLSSAVALQPLKAQVDHEQELVQIEQRWLEAESDPFALESILADDFVHVLPIGFITKAEQIRYLRSHPTNERGTTRHFENLRVRVYGNTGIVNGIVVATTSDGKARKTIFTDVFAYRGRAWQAVNAQESPLQDSPRT